MSYFSCFTLREFVSFHLEILRKSILANIETKGLYQEFISVDLITQFCLIDTLLICFRI